MNREETYLAWVPDLPDDGFGPAWTEWAKPVLFASMSGEESLGAISLDDRPQLMGSLRSTPGLWVVVVDLPGAAAIRLGAAMAAHGFRPVPLFNGCPGKEELINTAELITALRASAAKLTEASLPENAPPVFLLDSRRMARGITPSPGKFDNRWFTFPQDFPSANLLRARGITAALVIQEKAGQPAEDLGHVLRRWQDAGIEIYQALPESSQPERLDVARPPRFRSLWYGLLAIIGLMPNSAGGFGGVVPHPSAG